MSQATSGYLHVLEFGGELMFFIPREIDPNTKFWTLVASYANRHMSQVSLQFENHGRTIAHDSSMRLATDEDLRQLLRIVNNHPEVSQTWLEKACGLKGFSESERLHRIFQQVSIEQGPASISC